MCHPETPLANHLHNQQLNRLLSPLYLRAASPPLNHTWFQPVSHLANLQVSLLNSRRSNLQANLQGNLPDSLLCSLQVNHLFNHRSSPRAVLLLSRLRSLHINRPVSPLEHQPYSLVANRASSLLANQACNHRTNPSPDHHISHLASHQRCLLTSRQYILVLSRRSSLHPCQQFNRR
jgi:hypothetical protein